MFPVARVKTFSDLIELNKLFDDYKSVSSLLKHLVTSGTHLMTILGGFQLKILTEMHPLAYKSLGDIGERVITFGAIVVLEILTHRFWLYRMTRRFHVASQVPFVKLLSQVEEDVARKYVKYTKVMCLELNMTALIFNLIMAGSEIRYAQSIWGVVRNIYFFFGFFFVVRMGITDTIILYSLATAGYEAVVSRIKALKQRIVEYNEYPDMTFDIREGTLEWISSVKKLNSITKILMSSNDALVVPLGSGAIFLIMTPEQELINRVAKYIVLLAIIAYSIRGYILVAMLSRVDTMSKDVYSMITSTIVRAKHNSIADILRLRYILEDMACVRSQVVVREFTGRVTQMDVFNSIISTVSTLTLLCSFYDDAF